MTNTVLLVGSSIIFLVVIAIWAVFLLPDLQTRRHQLAQARVTNRALSTSRVLTRDAPEAPDTVVRESAAVPATSDRPAITASTGSTAVSEHPTELLDMSQVLATRQEPAETTRRPAAAPRHATAPNRAGGASNKTLAWVLAGCLLASLVALPVTVVLSAFSVIPWWSVAVAVAALAGCVAALRWRATRRRQARQSVRPAAPAPITAETRPMDRVIDLRDKPADQDRGQSEPARPEGRRPRQVETAFDQEQLDDEEGDAPAPAPVENGPTAPPTTARPVIDDRPGVWTPPKVPRPTYLMKPQLPQGPLTPPNIGVTATTAADPFGDLLESGDDDVDLPESRAV